MKLGKRVKEKLRGLVRPGGRARRYVLRRYSCEAFFRELTARKIQYVVLRWFETLPEIEPGEDVDMLIADDDLPRIADLFVRFRTPLACDVYSLTGLPGSDFRKMAYYPPYLAEQVIARAEVMRDLYRVPGKRDHFMTLAFHALYHKGYASGLKSEMTPAAAPKKLPDHDYEAALTALAKELSIQVEINLESLDAYITSEGWRPPFDMLARLALWNPWIHDRYFSAGLSVKAELSGVAVFLVRERAVDLGLADDAEDRLRAQGFQIVESVTIPPQRQGAVAARLRGGNWGRGPWAHSGGPPARVIVAWDPAPLPVEPKLREKYPLLENGRVLRAKRELRDHILRGLGKRDRFNPLHSADTDFQTWEYIEILLPDRLDDLTRKVEAFHAGVPC